MEIAELSEAELARKVEAKPPVLFRWLRGQRQPPAPRVRKINAAVAMILGSPNVADYLGAVATRNGLTSKDDRFNEDLSDLLVVVASYMRPGFTEAFMAQLQALEHDNKFNCVTELISYFRLRLIRNVSGRPVGGDVTAPFLAIADAYGLRARAWLKPNRELEYVRAERRFTLALEEALSATNLGVPERMNCEHLINEAFSTFVAERDKQHASQMRIAAKAIDKLGYGKSKVQTAKPSREERQ